MPSEPHNSPPKAVARKSQWLYVIFASVATSSRTNNPTGEPVVLAGAGNAIPLSFAACLVQLYRLLDTDPSGLEMALQLSVIDPICDTHLARVPKPARTLSRLFLA